MTATNDKWAAQEAGLDCYLCAPRLSGQIGIMFIATLSASSLYLARDQRFRGQSILILTDHVTQLDALPEKAYTAYMEDLRLSAAAIRTILHPDHMNIALLGNSCPHLHWSLIPRYRIDQRWGRPIWDDATLQEMRDSPVTLTDAEYAAMIEDIRKHL
jgi:diadenosine tetraphosphate (Ap4A) HIT family hydrolase